MMRRPNSMRKGAAHIGIWTVAIAFALTLPVATPPAAGAELSKQQLIDALKAKGKKGLVFRSYKRKDTKRKRFLDSIRMRGFRGLTSRERATLANMASEQQQQSVDLEIYFAFNDASIRTQSKSQLDQLGQALTSKELRSSTFLVAGHTDAKGSDSYNLKLSERRADAVRRFLVDRFNIDPQRIVAAGYGEERLKLPGQPFGAKNRRVQIVNLEGQ